MVNKYPNAPSAAGVCYAILPAFASSAMARASRLAAITSPSATETPRLFGQQ